MFFQDPWKIASAKKQSQNVRFLSIPISKAPIPTAKIIFVACRTSTLARNYHVSQTQKTLKRKNLDCKSKMIANNLFFIWKSRKRTFSKKSFRILDFSPCRNPKECVPMNRQAGVRVNLDMYKPKSCCATLSWNR
jgi:hypothetical protein